MHAHCSTPQSFLHDLTALKSTHTIKTDRKIKMILAKHFLTFKQFYLRDFLCVQSLSVEFFDDSRHFEKQFQHLLKFIRQNDDSDRRLERITQFIQQKCPVSLGNLFLKYNF